MLHHETIAAPTLCPTCGTEMVAGTWRAQGELLEKPVWCCPKQPTYHPRQPRDPLTVPAASPAASSRS
jgi:hypothetical protein